VRGNLTTYTRGMTDTLDDALDPGKVAALLGIKRASVHRYTQRGDIPPPDGYLGSTPYWYRTTIDAWRKARPGQGWRKGKAKAKANAE
jgi:predicted DNA-binding transcriptional regulator AlpA